MFIDKKLTILSQLFVYYILVFIGHKRHVLSFKSILKILPIFSFTMTTNKETFTTTLISFRTPIIITMILFFRFPPIIITMLFLRTPIIITMILFFRFPPFITTMLFLRTPTIITMILFFRFPPVITTMLFLRTPAIIFPGHYFIPPFNRIHTILCFSKRMACLFNLLFYLYMIECFLLDIEFIQTMLIFKR
ncbi:hypothetical protein bcere0007_52150 [Bacillus mycoides]|nr:hypothetical protein bcere0007_52150 [Bacillus mycoides]